MREFVHYTTIYPAAWVHYNITCV